MAGRGVIYHLPEQKKKQPQYDEGKESYPYITLQFCKDNIVKKWQLRFDIAKAALLRCKTYVFVLQKSRFWNAEQ